MANDERRPSSWPSSLAQLGAIRFARRYYRFREAVAFYRDVVGLPLCETFEGSYGSNGAIFALPDASITFEILESTTPVPIDPDEQLCLYFADARAMAALRNRLHVAGVTPIAGHPYWRATGALTYSDPEGRGLVLAPFVYGRNEPSASFAGRHAFPDGESV